MEKTQEKLNNSSKEILSLRQEIVKINKDNHMLLPSKNIDILFENND